MLSRQVRTLVSRTATQRSTITPPSRAYASVASTQDTKPPVAVYGIDGTYASALVTQSSQTESKSQASSSAPSYLQYEILTNLVHLQYTAAAKTSSLETTARALTTLADVFKKDPKLLGILGAPTLTPSDKSQIVQELLRHMGNVEKGDTVKNFMKTLANNNRLGILEGVCEKFAVLIGAAKGELELVVQSASKLDPKTLQRLETAVAKSEYSQGKKLKVVTKINPDIMGGLVVEIGDRTIDLSVSSKIAKMNKLLTDSL